MNHNNKTAPCFICLRSPLVEPAQLLACGHCFCFECLRCWAAFSARCPVTGCGRVYGGATVYKQTTHANKQEQTEDDDVEELTGPTLAAPAVYSSFPSVRVRFRHIKGTKQWAEYKKQVHKSRIFDRQQGLALDRHEIARQLAALPPALLAVHDAQRERSRYWEFERLQERRFVYQQAMPADKIADGIGANIMVSAGHEGLADFLEREIFILFPELPAAADRQAVASECAQLMSTYNINERHERDTVKAALEDRFRLHTTLFLHEVRMFLLSGLVPVAYDKRAKYGGRSIKKIRKFYEIHKHINMPEKRQRPASVIGSSHSLPSIDLTRDADGHANKRGKISHTQIQEEEEEEEENDDDDEEEDDNDSDDDEDDDDDDCDVRDRAPAERNKQIKEEIIVEDEVEEEVHEGKYKVEADEYDSDSEASNVSVLS